MHSRNRGRVIGWVFAVSSALACVPAVLAAEPAAAPVNSPLSPTESLKHFRLAPGLRLELVAAEPEVIDPVSIAFDEAGRLWAVEMTDYPNGPAPGEPPRSRIRLLEDRDADGRYETAVVFADKLLFVTGLQPWRGGVIATLAGEVAYFKDTDGDGRADVRETWFRGFAQENSQLRANHPRFGLDNAIYIANGLRSGTVVGAVEKWGKEQPAVPLSGMDFRFDPLTGSAAAVSGMGQFGMTFDDFGNRFVCSNRNPCRHIVLEDRYLKRNPFLGVRDVGADVSPAAADSRVFPLSRAWTTSTLHAGQFTAACGVTLYRGDALPAEFYGNSFTCEPTGNLVHRDIPRPSGATFASRPAYDGFEFLASPDEWFRPVDLANGPDGALYIVDMYRAVIEHPQWVPDELKNRPDQDYGNDRGRIYRVVSATAGAVPPGRRGKLPLAEASSAELVAALRHPNAWQRETAARLLYERQDAAVAPALEEVVKTAPEPVARVQALWTLRGLGKLVDATVMEALGDAHPRVREQAVLLSERWLPESPEMRQKVLALSQADDPRLRFQVALSLGQLPASREVLGALAGIALRGADDEWTRRAVLTAVPEQPAELLAVLLRSPEFARHAAEPSLQTLLKDVAELIGSRKKPAEVGQALQELAARPTANAPADSLVLLAAVNGLGQGAARRGGSLTAAVKALDDKSAAEAALREVFAAAVKLAQEGQAPEAARQQALTALQFAGFETAGPALLELAQNAPAQSIRIRAIEVLGTYREPTIGPALLERFAEQTPAVRRAVLQALTRDPQRVRLLLAEIAAKRIAVAELDPARVRELTNHADPAIKKEARALLAAALPADRKQVLESYQKALALKADAQRGRLIFEKNCTSCHRIGNLGVDVAPDIADSRTKTPAALLTDILNPNQAIDNNYLSYTVATKEGKVLTGIIATETASSITLRQPENKTEIILRQDIEEMRSNGVSLMPEGLEKNISIEQMADLIAFIKNWRYLDGQVPLSPAK